MVAADGLCGSARERFTEKTSQLSDGSRVSVSLVSLAFDPVIFGDNFAREIPGMHFDEKLKR